MNFSWAEKRGQSGSFEWELQNIVRESSLWTNHLRSSICRKFGPLFLGWEERGQSEPLCFIIWVRALEPVVSSLYICTYNTEAAQNSVIVYCSMEGAQSSVALLSSTWAIRVYVFLFEWERQSYNIVVCASSLYQRNILDPRFLFWEYIAHMIRWQVSWEWKLQSSVRVITSSNARSSHLIHFVIIFWLLAG